MSTVRTCTTPKEAWALVSHYLANILMPISLMYEGLKEEKDEERRGRREDDILRERSRLIGVLFELSCRMNHHGYTKDRDKIQELLVMVMNGDLSEHSVRVAINARHEELDDNYREFKALVGKMNKEHDRV